MTENHNPLLSVIVTTWNNESFIEECLLSVLNQKVDFKFEILVGNDCSTDSTGDIINQLAKEHPDHLLIVDREQNVGTSENFIDLVYKANGKYIAQVDGDDKLIDETKFQRQIDFLEKNEDCSICFHHYKNVDAQGNELPASATPFVEDTITSLDLLFKTTLGPGNTTILRASALPKEAPSWLRKCGNHKDFALQFLVASKGNIGYLNRVMSAYTIHENNITKTVTLEKLLINGVMINKGFLDYHKQLNIKEHQAMLQGIVNHRILQLAFFYFEHNRPFKFLLNLFEGVVVYRNWNWKMMKDAMYASAPTKFMKLKFISSKFGLG